MKLVPVRNAILRPEPLEGSEYAYACKCLSLARSDSKPIGWFDRYSLKGVTRYVCGIVLEEGTFAFANFSTGDKWSILGTYYGYPSCCIEWFSIPGRVELHHQHFPGTGYLNCPECAKKSKESLLEEIYKNRIANYEIDTWPRKDQFRKLHYMATGTVVL